MRAFSPPRASSAAAQLIDRYGIACQPVRDLLVRLPAGTPARGRLLDAGEPRAQPGQAVLARPGDSTTRASAPCACRRRWRPPGSSGSCQDSPDPDQRRGGRRASGPRLGATEPPGGRPRLLPRHRPMGDGGPGPVGTVGSALPGPRRGPDPQEGASPAASPGWTSGPASGCPVLPALSAAVDQARRPAAARLLAAAGPPPRRAVHRSWRGRCGRFTAAPSAPPDLGRGPRHRQAPEPDPARSTRVLGLGHRRSSARTPASASRS